MTQPLFAIPSTAAERRDIAIGAEIVAGQLAALDDTLHDDMAVSNADAQEYFVAMAVLRDKLRQLADRGYSATDAGCGTADSVAMRAWRTAAKILAALPAMGSA